MYNLLESHLKNILTWAYNGWITPSPTEKQVKKNTNYIILQALLHNPARHIQNIK